MNKIKVVTYTESREAFFNKKLKQEERGLDNLVKYGTDPDACAEQGEIVSFYRDALACLRECAERREGCEFCKNFDFSGASAKMDSGKYPHIHLAGGSYRYPRDEQFDYCPKCGRKLERSEE